MTRSSVFLTLFLAADALARVERVEVLSRGNYPHNYERIRGRVYYAIDPANAHNAMTADIDKAPRNARGEVEFSGDVDIVRPKDGGNGVVYIYVVNRGGRFFVRERNPDAWYLRQGFTLVDLAWQFDVRPDANLLHFTAPVAKGVRGHVRSDFVVPAKVFEHTIAHLIVGMIGGTGYPVADPGDAVLTERDAQAATRRTIPRAKWRFVDDRTTRLDDGFAPGKIYEIISAPADPAVVGTGLAAVRDFDSYVKNDPNAILAGK